MMEPMIPMRIRFLNWEKVKPIIKVKRNSIISSKNNKIGNREIRQQTEDLLEWKKKEKRRYRHR